MIRLVQEVPAVLMSSGYHKCSADGCGKSISLGQSYYEVMREEKSADIEIGDLIIKGQTMKVSRFYHEECIWAEDLGVEKVKENACPKCFMVGNACFCF